MATFTIHDILAQFREEELHNRHLGDRFERLICRYLELDPLFADRSMGERLNLRRRQRQRRQFMGKRPHADLDAKNISNTLRPSAHRI